MLRILSIGLTLAVLMPLDISRAGSFTVLHTFVGSPNDGAAPDGSLTEDSAGNLYGTTIGGGTECQSSGGCGTVFKLTADGTETVLYSFCAQANCEDGVGPEGNLVEDSAGNLYGTTPGGGANGLGTVFKVEPDGTESVVYSFCSQNNCTDGASPVSGLIMDESGNLYGTTENGGTGVCADGCGTVFKIAPDGAETVLHAFAGYPGDGSWPLAGLYPDGAGNLYGTTSRGGNTTNCDYYGTYGCGTVFEVAAGGTESMVYSFCAEENCPDGEYPWSGVIEDSSGTLYGTTVQGGTGSDCEQGTGCGTVFKIASDNTESVIYSFCSTSNCSDGYIPDAGVTADKKGNLYGTTLYGGSNQHSAGTIFRIMRKGTEKALTSFGRPAGGSYPQASLLSDSTGYFYGTTGGGGNKSCDCGVIFKRKE